MDTAALPDIRFTKGHGTGNDFILIEDPDGSVALTPDQVAALADRHFGIGADGVIRVVRSAALTDPMAVAAAQDGAEWFMDYSNADGSVAEMCGNGVRVFVHYLFENELVTGTSVVRVGTRAGVKTVTRIQDPYHDGTAAWYSAEMGNWSFPESTDRGADALVRIDDLDVPRAGLSVDMGNPHTVVALATDDELDGLSLVAAPEVSPTPQHGTNVELIVPGESAGEEGSLRMRVHERGVGETQSCGTGSCAAALAARFWAGAGAPDRWRVEVPGGTVRVDVRGQEVDLAGPAALVARGEVSRA
ncbi:diaminopimelate epimerase [Saxibacter everestensis]|uniref:Diaminopimelate epimerase n=1 Tax=Saxibacter everestensis TaxID=2909229 RepID=A0ABY8R0P7_9MICO|nr:diaminopimelate epimerase [Brevibacteriaceae bacterium ZFBP1038]